MESLSDPTTPDQGDERRALQALVKNKSLSAQRGHEEAAAAFVTYDGAAADLNELSRYVANLEKAIRALSAAQPVVRTDPSQPWTAEHLRSYPTEALALLNAARPVAQEASDPINDPEIVAIRTALDWISTGKNSTGKELADRAYLALGRVRAMIAAPQPSQGAPIDMVLHCPACGMQHIDAPEELPMPMPGSAFEGSAGWTNPPHRSHLCHGCGHIWRPADVPTNGVAAVKTKGEADSQPVSAEAGKGVEPVTVEAVATVARDGGLDWLIEGGPGALEPGEVLMICAERLTDDTGSGEVYRTPSESVAVSGDDWHEPHPPSRTCMCPSCIPSFDERFQAVSGEVSTGQILALERRSNMTDDEAIRYARSVLALVK